MIKKIMPFIILMTTISCSTIGMNGKNKIINENKIVQNLDFIRQEKLPKTVSELGHRTYTVGIDYLNNVKGDLIYSKPLIVKQNLYPFSTINKTEYISTNSFSNIIFEDNVMFGENARINIRFNSDRKIGDFILFKDATLNGKLYINIITSGRVPRTSKTPILAMNKNINPNNVILEKPVIIKDVRYVLYHKELNNMIIFYLQPIYNNETQYKMYLQLERMAKTPKLQEYVGKYNIIREKITTYNQDGNIATSNIIDIIKTDTDLNIQNHEKGE